MGSSFHTPVLAAAVVQYLPTAPDGVYVDGTLGGGGHAEAILMRLSSRGQLIGFDRDEQALLFARARLAQFGDRVRYIHENCANLRPVLEKLGVEQIHGLLLDLGISSHQVDDAVRGFSFQRDAHLDMRMDAWQQLDGWTVVNTYDEQRLADMFWTYGEEKLSRRIARRIVDARQHRSIDTTGELASIVESAVGRRFLQKSLARVFQAIRIEVNDELENLRNVLRDALDVLVLGGRIVVISYHSLEDRIVKDFFRTEARSAAPSGSKYLPDRPRQARLAILTKKPITPGADEIAQNPRARSAKLRVAERIGS